MISDLSILIDSLSLIQAFLRARSIFFLFISFERFVPYWNSLELIRKIEKPRTK